MATHEDLIDAILEVADRAKTIREAAQHALLQAERLDLSGTLAALQHADDATRYMLMPLENAIRIASEFGAKKA